MAEPTKMEKLVSMIDSAKQKSNPKQLKKLTTEITKYIADNFSAEDLKEKVSLPDGTKISILEYAIKLTPNTSKIDQENYVTKKVVETILAKAYKTTFTQKELESALTDAKRSRKKEEAANQQTFIKSASEGASIASSALQAIGLVGGTIVPGIGNIVGGVAGSAVGAAAGGMAGGIAGITQRKTSARDTKKLIEDFTKVANIPTKTPSKISSKKTTSRILAQ